MQFHLIANHPLAYPVDPDTLLLGQEAREHPMGSQSPSFRVHTAFKFTGTTYNSTQLKNFFHYPPTTTPACHVFIQHASNKLDSRNRITHARCFVLITSGYDAQHCLSRTTHFLITCGFAFFSCGSVTTVTLETFGTQGLLVWHTARACSWPWSKAAQSHTGHLSTKVKKKSYPLKVMR